MDEEKTGIEKEKAEIQKIGQGRKFLGMRLSALIEIIIFFAILIPIDWFFGERDSFFFVSPHPYWIIIILMSVQYGIVEGLLATVIATIVLLLGHLPERIILQDQFEYFFFVIKKPIFWFVAAVILGELRMRQIRERDRLRKIALEAKEKENTIIEAYTALKKVKEHIEINIASDMQTATMAYNSFKQLEKLGKEEVMKGGLDLIRILIVPEKFSIYLLKSGQLQCVGQEGWEEEDSYSRRFGSNNPLFQEIVGRQRVVTVVNESDRILLENEGSIAVPILDPAIKDVFGMLKIEKISFLRLRLNTIESLRLVGEWVGTAYASCLRQEEAEESRFIAKNTELLTPRYFEYQKQFLINLGKRLHIDISMLTISLKDPHSYSEEHRLEIMKTFRNAVQEKLRAVDQAFECEKTGTEMGLLLINTPVKNCDIVRNNVQKELENRLGKEISFIYRITSLYEKQD